MMEEEINIDFVNKCGSGDLESAKNLIERGANDFNNALFLCKYE